MFDLYQIVINTETVNSVDIWWDFLDGG